MIKVLSLFALLFIFSFELQAQTHPVKGTVTDDKGAPLQGVSVQVKGGKTVQTDANGNFTVYANSTSATLQITSVGFKPTSIAWHEGQQNVAVQMEKDAATLEEVVIGYQTVP